LAPSRPVVRLFLSECCNAEDKFDVVWLGCSNSGIGISSIRLVTNPLRYVTHSKKTVSSAFIEELCPETPHLDFVSGEDVIPVHFSAHYVEPVVDNWDIVDLDFYTDPSLRAAIDHALTTSEPVLTTQIPRLPSDTVVVLHP
jgi:hypothetical protein